MSGRLLDEEQVGHPTEESFNHSEPHSGSVRPVLSTHWGEPAEPRLARAQKKRKIKKKEPSVKILSTGFVNAAEIWEEMAMPSWKLGARAGAPGGVCVTMPPSCALPPALTLPILCALQEMFGSMFHSETQTAL